MQGWGLFPLCTWASLYVLHRIRLLFGTGLMRDLRGDWPYTIHFQGGLGRITLIRSALSNMPIYPMSLLRMPRMVMIKLEQIQRNFLWCGGALEKKPHLVNWSIVCSNEEQVGLGVKCLSTFNKALLCKWIWCFSRERNPLWSNVISTKFGEI